MAAHQYWRVLFVQSQDGDSGKVSVGELIFMNSSLLDLCSGGTPISSGSYNASYTASNAFDKSNYATFWLSPAGQFPAWLGYEFPAPVDVAIVYLYLATVTPGTPYPLLGSTFLQYSDDGVAWVSISPGTQMNGVSAGNQVLTLLPGDGTIGARGLTNPLGILRTAPPEALTPTGPGTRAMTEPLGRHDPWFGGNGFVAGTTKNTPDTPVGRRVVLLDQRTSIALRETWSDSVTGAYRFENLNRDARYTVISYDHTGSFKAVIADNLTAEVMP